MSMSTEYEYLYAFPIWLLSSRINNVIASLWGRHKMLATNNPNIQVLYLRHTLELAIVENLLTKNTRWTEPSIVNVSGFMMQRPLTGLDVFKENRKGHTQRNMQQLHATCYKIYGTRVYAACGTRLISPFSFPFPNP